MGKLLKEKGAALIRSFEAGARTGMMGNMGGAANRDHLQRLLEETAGQPDISYISIIDPNGIIFAHPEGIMFMDTAYKVIYSNKIVWRLLGVDEKTGSRSGKRGRYPQ